MGIRDFFENSTQHSRGAEAAAMQSKAEKAWESLPKTLQAEIDKEQFLVGYMHQEDSGKNPDEIIERIKLFNKK